MDEKDAFFGSQMDRKPFTLKIGKVPKIEI
jgi:hypothetical protein